MTPLSPHRSSRVSHPLKRYLDILTENLEEAFFVRDRNIRNDPKTYDEAMLDIDSKKWIQKLTPFILTRFGP